MPRKIRDLTKDLRDAGFVLLPKRGKGDHQRWEHPKMPGTQVGLDGRGGDDAHPYQEKEVAGGDREGAGRWLVTGSCHYGRQR